MYICNRMTIKLFLLIPIPTYRACIYCTDPWIGTGVERGNMNRKKIVPLGNVGDPGDNNAQKHFGPEKPERMHC